MAAVDEEQPALGVAARAQPTRSRVLQGGVINGHELFYREAGDPDAPTLVLLHGYPRLHKYFRESRVPLLAVWGEGDEIFGPAGARAFARDLPEAQLHLLPGGHFLLESAVDQVADLIRDFLSEVAVASPAAAGAAR